MVPASVANAEAEAEVLRGVGARATASSSRPGTGRSTASRCGPSATPSTPRPCGRSSSWTGCWSTASSTPPNCSTATGSPRVPTSTATTPTSGSGRSPTPTATPVGLYLGDFYAREGKRGGAWMSSFVRQSRLLGTRPVVVNNLNVSRAAGRAADPADPRRGEHPLPRVRPRPARAELGGHLPAVLRHQRCPATSSSSRARSTRCGRSGRRCSATTPGTSRPASRCRAPVVEAIDAARLWGEGFGTLEYLAATLLDQAWHRITPDTEVGDPIAFEQRALEDAGVASAAGAAAVPDDVLPAHLRRGLRGRVLLLHLVGGPRRRHRGVVQGERRAAPGERRRVPQTLLAVGGSVDPLAAFRAVRGRDADPRPLLAPPRLVTHSPGASTAGRPEGSAGRSSVLLRSGGPAGLQRSRRIPRASPSQPGQLTAPGPGRRGCRPRAPGGWAGGDRTPCSGAPPASPCPTSPPARSAPSAPALARPVAGQVVDVQRPQAVRAVVAVVPVGVGRHGCRAVHAREAGVLRPPGAAAHGAVRGRTARWRRPRR